MSQYCIVGVEPGGFIMETLRKAHYYTLPKIYYVRGVCDIRCVWYRQILISMETAFGIFGRYSWLIEKSSIMVALNHRSDAVVACSIAAAFHVLDVLDLTPLVEALNEFYRAILCHVPRSHKEVLRIFLWVLRK